MTREADPDPAKTRKAWFFRGFRDRYAPGYVRKHFHTVRISTTSSAIPEDDSPIIVVLNHPSWWDPMICTVLSREFGDREHYGVIEAEMLKKYGFFKYLGFFGVESKSLRGAAQFLRISTKLLSVPRRVLWITAQGEFSDVRKRPLDLKSGVGHLAERVPRVTILPVAIEYSFETEKTPEASIRIGMPIQTGEWGTYSTEQWTEAIEAVLTKTLDALNADVQSRDPSRFRIVLGGKVGVGGLYGLWQRFKCLMRGQCYRPAHGSETAKNPM